jgi:hypothetical protein
MFSSFSVTFPDSTLVPWPPDTSSSEVLDEIVSHVYLWSSKLERSNLVPNSQRALRGTSSVEICFFHVSQF